MRFRPRNWLYETRREETERRLSAVESNVIELGLMNTILQNRILALEALVNPPVIEPEEQ